MKEAHARLNFKETLAMNLKKHERKRAKRETERSHIYFAVM